MATTPPTVSRATLQGNALLLKCLYCALLLRYVLIFLVIPPLGREPNLIMWILAETPLLVFAYGVFKEKRRHIAGFCYVIIPYFMVVGANMFVPQLAVYIWTGLALFICAFISGMMHVRWTRAAVVVNDA